jgi:hypothetical protein
MKPIRAQSRVSASIGVAARARVHSGTLGELYRALVDGGRWWMVPMIAVLGAAAVLLVIVAAVEYVAPFVYTIF